MTVGAHVGKHILVVDDDPITISFLTEVLKSAGHRVSTALSGDEALRCVALSEPDLALLDINMPGMSGLELAQRLKDESGVSFMFLSASTDSEFVKQAVSYGAIGYLVKPIDAGGLIPSVEAALARAADLRQLRNSEANLTSALAAGRETSIAVGLLMATYHIDRHMAFEALRDHARSNRRKMTDVANELLLAAEVMNQFRGAVSRIQGT